MSTTEETNPNTVSGLSPPLDELRADLAATAAPGSTLAAEVTAVGAALAPTEPEAAPIGTDERGARLSRPAKSTQPTPPPATNLESLQSDTAKAVAMVASGTYSCLAITGRGGLGKSTAVQDAFDNHPNRANLDIDYFTGKSPTELYALLYERRLSAQITVLEDIEALLSQAQVVRILRAALWGPKHPKTKAMIRTVDWGSKTIAKMKDAAGNPIPNKFVYEGRIVFILNDMTGRDAARLALNTRIPTIEYTNVSNADVFTFMDEVLCRHGHVISTGIGPVKISRADCLAVIDHIRASTAYGLADLRMLEFGLKCFHDNKTGDAWKSLLDRFIAGANTSASHAAIKGARERLVLDLEANPAFPTIEARMAEFMRLERCADRTYWRYRKKAGLSESNNVLYSNYGLGPSPVTRRCKDCDKLYRISEYGAVDGTGTKDVCRYCQARPCLQCALPYPVWEHRASTGGFCAGCHKDRSVTPGPKAIAKGIAKFFKAIWAIYLTAKPQPLDADGNWTPPPVKAAA